MDDLLYVMLGIEGKYIRAKPVGGGKVRTNSAPVPVSVQ